MASKCRPSYPITPRTQQLFSLRAPTIRDDGKIEYIFPNPFQLFGLGLPFPPSTIEFGTSPNTYQNWDWDITSSQFANYSPLIAPLFVSFMYANRATDNPEFGIFGESAPFSGVTYEEVRAFGRFYGYMMNYLNDSLKPLNYNTFTEPILEIYKYWANLVTKTADDTILNPQSFITDPAKMLLQKMYKSGSDVRLWGVPGKYIIDPAAAAGGDPIAFAITSVNDNGVCPNINTITLPPIPTVPFIITGSFIDFFSVATHSIPLVSGPAVTPAITGNPASLSDADIMAWIQGEYFALTGQNIVTPINLAGNGFGGIEITSPRVITFEDAAGIDGCPFNPISPNIPGTQQYINIRFTITTPPNPFFEAFTQYFEDNGFYPNLITGEFYLPD